MQNRRGFADVVRIAIRCEIFNAVPRFRGAVLCGPSPSVLAHHPSAVCSMHPMRNDADASISANMVPHHSVFPGGSGSRADCRRVQIAVTAPQLGSMDARTGRGEGLCVGANVATARGARLILPWSCSRTSAFAGTRTKCASPTYRLREPVPSAAITWGRGPARPGTSRSARGANARSGASAPRGRRTC